MKRTLQKTLLEWKNQPERLPLILRGARQVGKTHLVETLACDFKHFVSINFELQPHFIACFNSLEPREIINAIGLLTGQALAPGETLLFLDEIQECPNALKALRYFKEQVPTLHVVSAGSLLEFALNEADFRMPVGRVQFVYIKPLSFQEFLLAGGYTSLFDFIKTISLDKTIPDPVHQKLLTLVKEYAVLGGMPAVLQSYFEHKNLQTCQRLHSALLATYRADFAKYTTRAQHQHVQRFFDRAPAWIGQQIKFSKIDPDVRARELKTALTCLNWAGILQIVYASGSSGLPLLAQIQEKKFKLLWLDVGLLKRTTQLDVETYFENDLLLVNRGALAEQWVGQELLAYQDSYEPTQLFYWARDNKGSTAEVDFVTSFGAAIVPIEVKSGSTGRLKSLHSFIEEKKSPLGIRISGQSLTLNRTDHILSVPFYLVGELPRLVRENARHGPVLRLG